MAEAATNIRVMELAEALRHSIERELSTRFSIYLPTAFEVKSDSVYEIKVRTQDGHLFLTVQQNNPGDSVKYISHRYEKL